MSRPQLNLQDNFLNQVRRENLEIHVVLLDGSQLVGQVKGFDNFTVIVTTSSGGENLIYKHAIAQLVASKPVVSAMPMRGSGPRRERGPRRRDNEGGRSSHDKGGQDNRGGSGDSGGKPSGPQSKEGGFNKLDLSSIQSSDAS